MSFFGTVLTIIVTLLHIYVFFHIYKIPIIRRFFSCKGIISTAFVCWLVFWLSRIFGGHDVFVRKVLECYGMHWMGSIFLLATGLLIADLISGFGFFFRKSLSFIRTTGLIFGIFMIILAHIQGIRSPVVTMIDVTIKNLPQKLQGTTIAVMADLHGGEMGIGTEWIDARVRQVLELQPDMIVLVGDIFEGASDPNEMIPIMQKLTAPLGVWAVRGNHDSRRPDRRDVLGEILRGSGIKLLENESVRVADYLILSGIDDLTASRRREGEGQRNIDTVMKNLPKGNVILLSHTPWMIDYIANYGVALMISGHTHNGQLWPFNYLVQARYPFLGGKYEIGDFTLIVNRGTGTWGPRMRLWRPGEISLINLN